MTATTAEEIRDELGRIGGLPPLLHVGDPKLKARFYEEVGLSGVYAPRTRAVDVEVRVLNDRVGGACGPGGTRAAGGASAPTARCSLGAADSKSRFRRLRGVLTGHANRPST